MNFMIKGLSNKIDRNNSIYKNKYGKEVNFGEISGQITFYSKIKYTKITLEKAKVRT